jgi:hypothetical protein
VELKKDSLLRVNELQIEVAHNVGIFAEWKAEFQKEHTGALNLFYLARAEYDKYIELQKQASQNDARAQEEMTAYLAYKDFALRAPDNQTAVNKSQTSLLKYNELRGDVKRDVRIAEEEMVKYHKLSQEYQQFGVELKGLKSNIHETNATANRTANLLKSAKAEFDRHSQACAKAFVDFNSSFFVARSLKQKLGVKAEHLEHSNRKWAAYNKLVQHYGNLKAGAFEGVAAVRADRNKAAQEFKKATGKWAKHKAERAVAETKHTAAKEAEDAFASTFNNNGCGLVPSQMAEKKEQQRALEAARKEARAATKAATEAFEAAEKVQNEINGYEEDEEDEEGKKDEEDKEDKEDPDSKTSRKLLSTDALGLSVGSNVTSDPVSDDCDLDLQMNTLNYEVAQRLGQTIATHEEAETKYSGMAANMTEKVKVAEAALQNLEPKAEKLRIRHDLALELRAAPCSTLTVDQEWSTLLANRTANITLSA